MPVLAATEPSQLILGVKGGYQWGIDDDYNHSNPGNTIFGIYSGLQLTPSWSWDIGYQYHDVLKANTTSIKVKTWLIESALRYDWYLQENLSLYGRLGITYWNMEKSQHFLDKSSGSGFSPLSEIGVNYHVNSNVKLSAGYQYIDSIGRSNTGKYDSNGVLVSLSYTFGSTNQPAPVEPSLISNYVEPESRTNMVPSKMTDIAFGFDSSELNDTEQLTGIISVLNTYPQAKAIVVGHTSSIGTISYNQKLSERRAQTIVNKLIKQKVSLEQLKWRGEDESRPIADNNTMSGRAKNRRVEVTIPSFQF